MIFNIDTYVNTHKLIITTCLPLKTTKQTNNVIIYLNSYMPYNDYPINLHVQQTKHSYWTMHHKNDWCLLKLSDCSHSRLYIVLIVLCVKIDIVIWIYIDDDSDLYLTRKSNSTILTLELYSHKTIYCDNST